MSNTTFSNPTLCQDSAKNQKKEEFYSTYLVKYHTYNNLFYSDIYLLNSPDFCLQQFSDKDKMISRDKAINHIHLCMSYIND